SHGSAGAVEAKNDAGHGCRLLVGPRWARRRCGDGSTACVLKYLSVAVDAPYPAARGGAVTTGRLFAIHHRLRGPTPPKRRGKRIATRCPDIRPPAAGPTECIRRSTPPRGCYPRPVDTWHEVFAEAPTRACVV